MVLVQTFVKDKKDYLPLLQPAIDEFWAEQDTAQPVLGEASERLVPRRW